MTDPKQALHVAPAYGQDYGEEWDARCAWYGGRDFKVLSGPYVSVRDAPHLCAEGYPCVVIHFDGFRRRTIVGIRRRDELDHAAAEARWRAHRADLAVGHALGEALRRLRARDR